MYMYKCDKTDAHSNCLIVQLELFVLFYFTTALTAVMNLNELARDLPICLCSWSTAVEIQYLRIFKGRWAWFIDFISITDWAVSEGPTSTIQ